MTDVPGHECNAFCRPDEATHCHITYVFLRDGETLEDWLPHLATGVWVGRRGYSSERTEPAYEVPDLPRAEWEDFVYRHAGHRTISPEFAVRAAPVLVWFLGICVRVAVPA